MEKATIHDIARKLDVTASTVSRALSGHPGISAKTRKAVLKAAQSLNYQPNTVAAALRNGKSNIIGIIVPTIDRTFFSSVVCGIEEIANTSKYHVLISQTYDNYKKEVAAVQALLNAHVAGIIASFSKETQDFSHFLKVKVRGVPLILFDRSNDELNVSHVLIDDYLGAYRATEHLIHQGCTRIAHFTSTRKISIFAERLRGYTEALQNNGLEYDPSFVLESNLQLQDGRQGMLQLLDLVHKPDAVFSASAYGIMGALQVLKEKKIEVPDEIALVCFSNEPFTSFSEPAVTTVDQHSVRLGNVAANIFLDEVTSTNKQFIPQKIVLQPELIIRASSLRSSKSL